MLRLASISPEVWWIPVVVALIYGGFRLVIALIDLLGKILAAMINRNPRGDDRGG